MTDQTSYIKEMIRFGCGGAEGVRTVQPAVIEDYKGGSTHINAKIIFHSEISTDPRGQFHETHLNVNSAQLLRNLHSSEKQWRNFQLEFREISTQRNFPLTPISWNWPPGLFYPFIYLCWASQLIGFLWQSLLIALIALINSINYWNYRHPIARLNLYTYGKKECWTAAQLSFYYINSSFISYLFL